MLSSRKKSCYFKRNNIQEIDYKDVKLLTKFINDQGKITPRRVTGTSSKMHRKLVLAIKRELESVLKQVEDLSLSLKMQSEEDSKLFGSVTKLDIVKLLEENGITIDKKYVDLSSPIKTLGEHKVNIMFTKEMSASFTLTVEKED